MYRFIETICVSEGKIRDPEVHLTRIRITLFAHYGKWDDDRFSSWFDIRFPLKYGWYKYRLIYTHSGVQSASVTPYQPRSIRRLRLVHADKLEYAFKYEDRSGIDQLMATRGQADDILIVKNGYLSDSSYANILLWDGSRWWTPDTPLLQGTMRQRLLSAGQVRARPIPVETIWSYERIKLVNAMLDLEAGPELVIGPKTIKK